MCLCGSLYENKPSYSAEISPFISPSQNLATMKKPDFHMGNVCVIN